MTEMNEKTLQNLKKTLLRKYPTFGSTINGIDFKSVGDESAISTACTNGKTIFFNENFMSKLSKEQQLFILAHEVGHIALKHCERGKDKDASVFNFAADAVLNQFLLRDGLEKVDGIIDIPEAINYSVDELYEKLMTEKQQQLQSKNKEQKEQNSANNQQNNSNKNKDDDVQSCPNCNQGKCNSTQNDSNACQNGSNGQQNDSDSSQNTSNGQHDSNSQENNSNEKENSNNDKQNNNSGHQISNNNQQNDSTDRQNDSSDQNGNNGQSDINNSQSNGNSQQNGNNGFDSDGNITNKYGIDWNGNDGQNVGHDDHNMWDEVQNDLDEQKDDYNIHQQGQVFNKEFEAQMQPIDERQIFENNSTERVRRAKEIMANIAQQAFGIGGQPQLGNLGDIGTAQKTVVNWKKVLRKELEIEDEAWGYRFSDSGNGYKARLEDVEYEEMADTEIILDVSGSVSKILLVTFLRQMKLLLKDSNIKVGTFSNSFHGWHEIKNTKDIDKFAQSMYIGGGTNFDSANNAFSKDPRVNKIVFTDGQDGGDPQIQNPRKDIIWITFENPYFKPAKGKVIYVPPEKILQTNLIKDDLSR